MKKCIILLIILGIISCKPNSDTIENVKTGSFNGSFKYGNFSDTIQFEIERDSANYLVFFTSLEQNANRIPFRNIEVKEDSINLMLQSDYYTYTFKNKWIDDYTKLQGSLTVDTIIVPYTLERDASEKNETLKSEETSFISNGINLNGTIWNSKNESNKGLVIVTSSGNEDRSSSRAEAILFAKMGYTTFHYDKRGTGNSEGNWEGATMEDLLSDDIKAIHYFSDKKGIPLSNIGIKGSSQGATKIPYLLNALEDLKYGIAVSCPGTTLLESDLNYWKNINGEAIGTDIEEAMKFQKKVYEYIAGAFSKVDLEQAIENAKGKSWIEHVWIPNLEDVVTDKKLLYSPVLYFETTKQPLLILQGTLDEIIPENSHETISNALTKAGNTQYKTILIDSASHAMNFVGKSDFPYWSKLHPDYLNTIEKWLSTVSN